MKKSIFISVIVVIIAVCVVGNIKDTANFSGVLMETDGEVNVKITRTFIDKLFNRVSSDIIVDGDNIDYVYILNGEIFNMDRYYAAPIRRMDAAGLASQGYLFFDKKMKNIVIKTEREIIYSCEKEFWDMVIK